ASQLPDLAGAEEGKPGPEKNIRIFPRGNRPRDLAILVLQYREPPWRIAPNKCDVLRSALPGLHDWYSPGWMKFTLAAGQRSSLQVKSSPSIIIVDNY
ncbi:hypothetical protein JTM43_37105, partial [Pseudomonas aeruginosa]|nr:hypothetical protein [Pseudomonas aeruginosa]